VQQAGYPPQLLQLSGVGNAAELEALGVDVVANLPAVGENLQAGDPIAERAAQPRHRCRREASVVSHL
jgi:choline dehydrogenase-like flavoprotein